MHYYCICVLRMDIDWCYNCSVLRGVETGESYVSPLRGVGAAGSAFDWQSRGHGFESRTLHQEKAADIANVSAAFYFVLK